MFFGALRPAEGGIASYFSSDWLFSSSLERNELSIMLFLA
jgi:hypothetical protein